MTPDSAFLIQLQSADVRLGQKWILRDLDFTLEAGAHTTILGSNGSGKSTFLRLLSGQIWPVKAQTRLYCFGQTPTFTPLLAREKIALLSPEIQENYVRRSLGGAEGERGWNLNARETVATGFFESALLHQRPTPAQWGRVEELLREWEIESYAERPLLSLSQGQLRRVLLARALVKNPRVLLLDEAAGGLDKVARRSFLTALEILAARGQTTLVIASHRAEETLPGTTCWQLENARLHRVAAPSQFPVKRLETAPEKLPLANKSGQWPQATARFSSEELIRLENAAVVFDGTPILAPINWIWRAGTHWKITGPNGSGKSTFLRLLRGEVAPAWGGKIVWSDGAVAPSREAIGARIALVSPQNQARFDEEISVFDAVASALQDAFRPWRAVSPAEKTTTWAALEQWDLADWATRNARELSYGQTRRVHLARAFAGAPALVLLDEALEGLDSATRQWCFERFESAARNGVHFAVAAHHDEDFPDFLNAELQFLAGRLLERALPLPEVQ